MLKKTPGIFSERQRLTPHKIFEWEKIYQFLEFLGTVQSPEKLCFFQFFVTVDIWITKKCPMTTDEKR